MRFSLGRLLNHLRFKPETLRHEDGASCTDIIECPIFVQFPGGILVEVWDARQRYTDDRPTEIVLKLRGDRS